MEATNLITAHRRTVVSAVASLADPESTVGEHGAGFDEVDGVGALVRHRLQAKKHERVVDDTIKRCTVDPSRHVWRGDADRADGGMSASAIKGRVRRRPERAHHLGQDGRLRGGR